MNQKKLLFLFLALLLPVLIFVFLKRFGANEFSVPVYHETGVISAGPDCDFNYDAPYRVADSLMVRLGVNDADSLCVFYFGSSLETAMNRVATEFRGQPVRRVAVPNAGDLSEGFIRNCVFLMEEHTSVALVDHRNRIRGYYDGSDRDDIDRLIVEMKIILKKY